MEDETIRHVTSREGYLYAKKHNGELKTFDDKYMLKSQADLVFALPNGEVVLIGLSKGDNYPGFIFGNYLAFDKCRTEDYFPIPLNDQTWREVHAADMQDFSPESQFFLSPLTSELKISVPFRNTEECKSGYEQLTKVIHSNKASRFEKDELLNCYALAFTQFLVATGQYRLHIKKGYEYYNPYYYVTIINSDKDEADVFSQLLISLGDKSGNAFNFFYWAVTNKPLK
ncbi:hypothetical protein [Mucilaginibacter sp. L3T2-6]|uniref:hypothetical protein n=1 Tax=Mucilaginibacter sp. L3T2-6 TaxID=3062491 RepID=UPI00267501BE|nr:hypothetical protein [Mucilaginibacter sp. L3T2-6]MDO3645140.1 hypothetical protein [Mucilaginibacter sp. L3T2-6]MDV6217592.1 hypothetical protein [Mucilaginibacter sp. L3T2-6]